MTKYRTIRNNPLNPEARERYVEGKGRHCGTCKEPNGEIEVYELTSCGHDDRKVNYGFRKETDVCRPVESKIQTIIDGHRLDTVAGLFDGYSPNTRLRIRIRPPFDSSNPDSPTRSPFNARFIGRAANYVYARTLSNRDICTVEYLGRYEGDVVVDAGGAIHMQPAPPQPPQPVPQQPQVVFVPVNQNQGQPRIRARRRNP